MHVLRPSVLCCCYTGRTTTPEPSDNAQYADYYHAKLWPVLETLDLSSVSEAEADDLRSVALLHSGQKVLAARPTGDLVSGIGPWQQGLLLLAGA